MKRISLFLFVMSFFVFTQAQNKALLFHGNSTDNVSIADAPELNPTTAITVEAWINANNWRGAIHEGTVIGKEDYASESQGYVLRTGDGGDIEFVLGIGAGEIKVRTDNDPMSAGTWYHVAGTYDGTVAKLYIDGVEVASNNATGTIVVSSRNLEIGRLDKYNERYFDGMIDEVRVWGVALDAATINTWKDIPVTGTHANYSDLICYYELNDDTDPLVAVATVGNNGTVTGAEYIGYSLTCPQVIDLSVTNIEDISADLSWIENGSATTWNIEWDTTGFTQGLGTTVVATGSSSYSLTGLLASTSYEFYVQADCGSGDVSTWVGPYQFTTTVCPTSNQCGYTVYMSDAYGPYAGAPSWDGASVEFIQNGVSFANIALLTGTEGTEIVNICDASNIELVWNAGGYPLECGFSLTDPFGEEVFSFAQGSAPAEGTFHAFTSSCTPPSCLLPVALDATVIDLTSIDLSWTENGTATTWNIEWGLAEFAQGSGTSDVITETPVYSLTDLTETTDYEFYVQSDCGGTQSVWAGPYTFSTVAEGAVCGFPIALTLPVVSEIGNTAGFGDDYNSSMACGSSYMNGDDIVYEFTLAEDGFISGDLTTTNYYPGMFILDGCPDAGGNCIVSSTSVGLSTSFIDEPISAGTYFLIISNEPLPQSIDFDFNLSFRTPNTETEILTYSFPEEFSTATIDAGNHTVNIVVGNGVDLTALVADFTLSVGANAEVVTVAQESGVTVNDLFSDVTYTITAEDGVTIQDWVVTVTEAAINTATDILTYSFDEQTGAATIDATAHTVNIEVNWEADIASLVADFTLSYGATATALTVAQESGITANDFTSAVDYTITAEDGSITQVWSVTVTQEAAPLGVLCSNPIVANLGMNIADNSAGDQWFSFTAAEDGNIRITTCGHTTADTEFYVYSDCPATDQLAYNDQFCGNQSEATIAVTNGSVYYIRWTNEWTNATFDWEIETVILATDATLSDLTIDGTTVDGFASDNYEYDVVLPFGTTVAPVVGYTLNDANANAVVNDAIAIPGSTTVVVTAEDGSTTLTYTVNFTLAPAPSDDATLVDLTVNGETVDGFASDVYTYMVELPYGTTVVPTVTYTLSDANASVVVTDASNLPGNTTVSVTAENEIATKLYTIIFSISTDVSDDATLSDLTVNGETVDGFASDIYTYNIVLPYGTTDVPTVGYVLSDVNATVVQTDATVLPGTTTVVVTAEDGTTLTYTINFTVAVGVNIVDANSNISVYPNPNDGLFNVNITIPVQANIELQLLNVQGQLIDIYNVDNVTEINKEFDVTGLSSGVYFLKINTGNQIKVEKVIVK